MNFPNEDGIMEDTFADIPRPDLGDEYMRMHPAEIRFRQEVANGLFWLSVGIYLFTLLVAGVFAFLIGSSPVHPYTFAMLGLVWISAIAGVGLSALLSIFTVLDFRWGLPLFLIESLTLISVVLSPYIAVFFFGEVMIARDPVSRARQ